MPRRGRNHVPALLLHLDHVPVLLLPLGRYTRKLIERKREELEAHGVCYTVSQTPGALGGCLRPDTEFAVPCNKFTRVLACRSQKRTSKYPRGWHRHAKVVGVIPLITPVAQEQAKIAWMAQSVDSWSEYRKRRNVVLFLFIGYVPVVFGVGVLSDRLFSTFTPAFVLAFVWMAFLVIASNLSLRFPCPRCGKWFFAKWWYYKRVCTTMRPLWFTEVC